ncbi:MAG: succinate dehydrogenase / fumarate reductase cytochrome b subunit [Halieaceae bacterium]
MKDTRPVNLDIGTMKLPITAYASITHRVSGVVLVVAAFIMLWALEKSLASPEGFAALAASLGSPLAKFVAWGICTALIYHSLAGVRHVVMDFGIGESLEGGILSARILFVLAVVGSLITGVALW